MSASRHNGSWVTRAAHSQKLNHTPREPVALGCLRIWVDDNKSTVRVGYGSRGTRGDSREFPVWVPNAGISTYGLPSPRPGIPAAASRNLYSSTRTPRARPTSQILLLCPLPPLPPPLLGRLPAPSDLRSSLLPGLSPGPGPPPQPRACPGEDQQFNFSTTEISILKFPGPPTSHF